MATKSLTNIKKAAVRTRKKSSTSVARGAAVKMPYGGSTSTAEVKQTPIPLGNNLPDNRAMKLLSGSGTTVAQFQKGLMDSFRHMETAARAILVSELEITILVAKLVRLARTNRGEVIQAINVDGERWNALKKNTGIEVEVRDVLYGLDFPKLEERSIGSKARIRSGAKFLSGYHRDNDEAWFDAVATLNSMQDLKRLRFEAGDIEARKQPARQKRVDVLSKEMRKKGTVLSTDNKAPPQGQLGLAVVEVDENGELRTYGYLHKSGFGKDRDAEKGYFDLLTSGLKAALLSRGANEKQLEKLLSSIKPETARNGGAA